MSAKPLVTGMVVRGGQIKLADEFGYVTAARRRAAAWGEGRALTCRIEPEDEAWRHSDVKHLYGHLYTPVSKRTGETVAEVHMRMKANHFPDDGRESLTDLNRDEMRSYIESVEQDIRENDPDSWMDCCAEMELYEGRQHQRA